VRKYLTLMFWRIPALILAAVAYGIWHNGLISLAIILVSVPLPWMAVLIANDRPPRRGGRAAGATTRGAGYRCFRRPSGLLWSAANTLRRNRTGAIRRAMFPAEKVLALFSAHSQVDSA